MGRLRSEEEMRLQRKLIPLNFIICIISLIAAITLFVMPVIKVDAGEALHSESVMEKVESMIDENIGESLSGSDQEGVDYKPVVTMLVKKILGGAEGEISVSALSSFKVLTGSGDKSQKVMDELLLGEGALATKLIDSVVDSVANLFETDEGKSFLEEALVSTMTQSVINNISDEEVKSALEGDNIKELVNIMRDLSDPEKVPDGKVDAVANTYIDKLDEMLGDGIEIGEEDRKTLTAEVQKLYDGTYECLKDGESVDMESIICVTLSKNIDLSTIKIDDLLGNLIGDDGEEGSVHKHTVEDGGSTESGTTGDGGESTNKIVTNYNDLLLELGYDEAKKAELKQTMHDKLTDALNGFIDESGVKEYMGYYGYVSLVMMLFTVPWLILFLFSFFHMLAGNKRFTMWYVKLLCWIPPLIWLALKLLPVLAPKISFLNEIWNGEYGGLVQSLTSATSSYTWISGICYILLWLLSIFWAFPIKHKIRKERKYGDDYDY